MYVYDAGKMIKIDFKKKPQIPLCLFYVSTIQSHPTTPTRKVMFNIWAIIFFRKFY